MKGDSVKAGWEEGEMMESGEEEKEAMQDTKADSTSPLTKFKQQAEAL